MAISPTCTVNGAAAPQDVTASSTVTIALANATGVRFWGLQVIAADDLTNVAAIQASLVINQVSHTATFTAPSGLGSSVILQSTVGIGNSSAQGTGTDANNQPQAAFTTTFKVNVKTGAGLRVLTLNEIQEQGPSGWIAMLNAAIRAVAAATLAVSGSGLVHQTGGSTDSTAYKGTAGQFLVTNAAASDTAWASISGDASASVSTVGKLTVTGIQNNAVPAPSGSNTVLQWSGTSFSWASVSSGFASLTGVDVVAADSAHTYVVSISGSGGLGGTIPVNASSLQFAAAQTAAGIGQVTATSDVTPANLVFTPQGPFASASTTAHKTPGSAIFNLAAPVSGGNNAVFAVAQGGTATANMVAQAGLTANGASVPVWAIWLGPVSPTFHNINFGQQQGGGSGIFDPNGASLTAANADFSQFPTIIIADPVEGCLLYPQNAVANSLPAPGINVRDTFIAFALNEPTTSAFPFSMGEFSTSRRWTCLNYISGPAHGPVSTNIPSGDGVTLVANALVNPVSAPTNGALLYASGGALFVYQSNGSSFQISPGGGGGTVTGVDVAGVDNAHVYVQSISGASGAGGLVTVGVFAQPVALKFPSALGQVMLYCGSQSVLLNDGSNNPQLNGAGSVQVQVAGTPLALFSGAGLLPDASLSSFMLGWNSGTTVAASGSNLLLQPQFSTNANPTGGNLVAELQSPGGGSGSEAFFQVWRGGTYNGAFTVTMSLGALPGSSGLQGAIFGKGLTPSASNYALTMGGTFTSINAPTSGGALGLQVNASNIINLTSSLIAPQISSIAWAISVSAPKITQTTPSSDISTQNLTIAAQNAYGSAVTNVGGGFLLLGGGDSTSPGTTGKRGGVQIHAGNPLNTGVPMLQVLEPVIGQRIVALATTSTVSSTDMPANTGDAVVYVRNASTAPTASATNGGILYAQSGALKWRGSSGTVTTLGPAEPHCPACGSDYVVEHENEKWGYNAVCLRCLGEQFGDVPWVMKKKAA